MDQQTPLQRAIDAAGGVAALARALGVTSQAVSQWDGIIPINRVPAVSKLTGIPKRELRPEFDDEAPATPSPDPAPAAPAQPQDSAA